MTSKPQCALMTVIRRGETAWDAERRLTGRNNLPLTAEGRDSVAHDAAMLVGRRLTTVHHPPDDAAAETAEIVAQVVGAKRREMADLADADLGLLTGLQEQEFAERFAKRFKQWQDDPLSLSPPEGEDVAEARARLFGVLGRLMRRSREDEVAAVLHPLGLGLLRCWLADRPASDLWVMVRDRPRIERYALGMETLDQLEEIGKSAQGSLR